MNSQSRLHLNNAEMAELLMESSGGSPHVEQCAACRTELELLRRTMRGLILAPAERPEEFWERQRIAIKERAGYARQQPAGLALAWAGAAAAVIAAVAGLLLTVPPAPAPPQAQADPDHELLIEVERAVQSDVPQALEPAAFLTREISQNMRTNSISPVHKKEIRHED